MNHLDALNFTRELRKEVYGRYRFQTDEEREAIVQRTMQLSRSDGRYIDLPYNRLKIIWVTYDDGRQLGFSYGTESSQRYERNVVRGVTAGRNYAV